MSKTEIAAVTPLPLFPSSGATLRAALFTSYRPVSSSFLLGEVLPFLIGIDRKDGDEQETHDWFIAEAINALLPLAGKLTVISSAPNTADQASPNPWLHKYVTPYYVGRYHDAIQHAKLWLCHWATAAGELLQITVSSTNLTSDAFHGQIQSGWTMTVPLAALGRRTRANTLYAPLVDFLSALGDSAGCAERTDYFNELLTRCPKVDGIGFIASIPGARSPLAQLRTFIKGRARNNFPK